MMNVQNPVAAQRDQLTNFRSHGVGSKSILDDVATGNSFTLGIWIRRVEKRASRVELQ